MASDVLDIGGKQLLRAKYIGIGTYGLPEWLVYGNDFDTCGAIVGCKDGQFAAFQEGNFRGAFNDIRAAVSILLTAEDRADFHGTIPASA